MIEVGTYVNRSDAELVQSVLAAAGIESEVSSDDAGGAYPFDLGDGARLLVDETDVARATAILAPSAKRDHEELS
jgi:Putative prokaryotic signal transducing protein